MTLEDIGNLGEAISSIGLLITIVFLIIEMRWSRRELLRQHRQQIFQSNLELELSLVGQKTRELEERWSNATWVWRYPTIKAHYSLRLPLKSWTF